MGTPEMAGVLWWSPCLTSLSPFFYGACFILKITTLTYWGQISASGAQKALASKSGLHQLGMVGPTCNPSTRESEEEGQKLRVIVS